MAAVSAAERLKRECSRRESLLTTSRVSRIMWPYFRVTESRELIETSRADCVCELIRVVSRFFAARFDSDLPRQRKREEIVDSIYSLANNERDD